MSNCANVSTNCFVVKLNENGCTWIAIVEQFQQINRCCCSHNNDHDNNKNELLSSANDDEYSVLAWQGTRRWARGYWRLVSTAKLHLRLPDRNPSHDANANQNISASIYVPRLLFPWKSNLPLDFATTYFLRRLTLKIGHTDVDQYQFD